MYFWNLKSRDYVVDDKAGSVLSQRHPSTGCYRASKYSMSEVNWIVLNFMCCLQLPWQKAAEMLGIKLKHGDNFYCKRLEANGNVT